jgi:DNA-binding transcriptional LysR family regulator
MDIKIAATATGFLGVAQMLPGSQMVAVLPLPFAQSMANHLSIRLLPLPFQMPEHIEIMMWHRRNEPDPGHAWFRQLVTDVARDLVARK